MASRGPPSPRPVNSVADTVQEARLDCARRSKLFRGPPSLRQRNSVADAVEEARTLGLRAAVETRRLDRHTTWRTQSRRRAWSACAWRSKILALVYRLYRQAAWRAQSRGHAPSASERCYIHQEGSRGKSDCAWWSQAIRGSTSLMDRAPRKSFSQTLRFGSSNSCHVRTCENRVGAATLRTAQRPRELS